MVSLVVPEPIVSVAMVSLFVDDVDVFEPGEDEPEPDVPVPAAKAGEAKSAANAIVTTD